MKVLATSFVKSFIDYFLPGKCFDAFMLFDFFQDNCLSLLISRILGVGITVGSSLLFVPQILKTFNAKSADGISLAAQLFGLVSYSAISAYSYERKFVFGQWGESFFAALQTVIIIMQILYYSKSTFFGSFIFGLFYFVFSISVFYHFVPMRVLDVFQAVTLPIIFLSKGIQIWTNFAQKGTGQLSLISVSLQFFGCCARVFTTFQEAKGDWLILTQFVLASILNGVIFVQLICYSRSTVREDYGKKKI